MLSEVIHSTQSPINQYYTEMELEDEDLTYASKQ